MRKILFLSIGLVTGSCNSASSDALSDEVVADLLVDQIRAGSPKACSAEAVRKTVIDLLTPDFEPGDELLRQDIEVGLHNVGVELDAITLDAVDKDVGGISCQANVVINTPNMAKREFSVSYLVRPSAESDEEFVVRGDLGDAATVVAALTSSAISTARQQRLEAAQASAVDLEPVTEDDLTNVSEGEEYPGSTEESAVEDSNVNAM